MTDFNNNPMIYINPEWDNLYDTLCRGTDSVFNQMTSLFTLCAAIGHLIQEPRPLKKKVGKFRWANLNQELDVSVLSAIAWDHENRELKVFSDNKRIIDIACDYAEGGMQYLFENFFEDHLMDNGQLNRPDKLDLEFNLAQIIEGLRQQHSIF
jgi:hypothetical protein